MTSISAATPPPPPPPPPPVQTAQASPAVVHASHSGSARTGAADGIGRCHAQPAEMDAGAVGTGARHGSIP